MSAAPNWRGRLVAYGAALERRFTRKGIEGSNPSLSATLVLQTMNPSHDQTLQTLVSEYYASRPNLSTPHKPLCVFFLACMGAGKSTITEELVQKLQCTYISND